MGEDTRMKKQHPFDAPICDHCGIERTVDGHDGCLGTLEGNVMNACCNHGGTGEGAYIQYWDGRWIGGEEAFKEFKRQGVGPHELT